jgi:preprotein translocase subunit SecE
VASNYAASITQYLRDTRSELNKVVWPTREEAINLTIVVLIVTIIMTIILGGIDWVFSQVLNFLLTLEL